VFEDGTPSLAYSWIRRVFTSSLRHQVRTAAILTAGQECGWKVGGVQLTFGGSTGTSVAFTTLSYTIATDQPFKAGPIGVTVQRFTGFTEILEP